MLAVFKKLAAAIGSRDSTEDKIYNLLVAQGFQLAPHRDKSANMLGELLSIEGKRKLFSPKREPFSPLGVGRDLIRQKPKSKTSYMIGIVTTLQLGKNHPYVVFAEMHKDGVGKQGYMPGKEFLRRIGANDALTLFDARENVGNSFMRNQNPRLIGPI